MKNVILLSLTIIMCSCFKSTPSDMEPVIDGRFDNYKSVFYPSTDCIKVCAIVVDKNGDVWYLRMNAYGTVRDEKKLFNLSDYDN